MSVPPRQRPSHGYERSMPARLSRSTSTLVAVQRVTISRRTTDGLASWRRDTFTLSTGFVLDATIHGAVPLRESVETVAAPSADEPSRTATLEYTAPVLPLLHDRPTQLFALMFALTWSVPGRTPLAKHAT